MMRVIIADDTPSDEFEFVADGYPFVSQVKMPKFAGWFAGRALAISQVATEFFVWVDDDFYFTELTDLQYLLDVITSNGIG